MKRKIAILVNRRAGSGNAQRLVRQLIHSLQRRQFEPHLCTELEELSRLMEDDHTQWHCAISAGGDGTLLEVVNRTQGVPISILPLGNENLVAKYVGLIRSGTFLAETIAEGRRYETDLASINGRIFSVMASIGIDADVVHRVHRQRRGHIGKQHYVVPTFQALSNYAYPPIEVEIENTGERLQGAMVFVFNIPQYALNLPIAQKAHPSDGQLDVYVFQKPGMPSLLRYLWNVVRGRHLNLPDVEHRQATKVHLRADKPTPVQIDGDPAGALPVTVQILPKALTLIVPRQGHDRL